MARRTLGVITMLGLACLSTATAADAQAPPALAVTVNASAIAFGDPLRIGVTVDNPGGGPAADFVFALLLPDGSTLVSAGPGIGVRFGRLSDLRSIVPVVRGVPLAGAFQFQEPSFFNYTFTGIEPQGTYRIVFAAFTAGALDDGVIGGGELLALASRDVTVSAAPPLTTEDPARRVTAVVPRAGGTVQAVDAAGATLTLTVPPNAVPADTAISITPLTAFQNLPLGPLVSGVSLEPSGLTFATPATLTITLPAGYVVPPLGLAGFLADGAGRNLQQVPATVSGSTVTLTVPHFSTSGVALDNSYFEAACDLTGSPGPPAEQIRACNTLRPMFASEMARLARVGGPVDPNLTATVVTELFVWMRDGLEARLTDAAVTDPADPSRKALAVSIEFLDWIDIFAPLIGISDRTNETRLQPLGVFFPAFGRVIDGAQGRYRDALLAAMNAVNVKCLAERATVGNSGVSGRVSEVLFLRYFWAEQFPSPRPEIFLPFDEVFCVDIRIDAAPPPVLTPGTGALMPIDLRIRYIDGVELPGPPLVVAITATNGSVSPAGGTRPAPIFEPPVTLTPTATSSAVTITAAFGADPAFLNFEFLPVRSRTFTAGQSLPITLSGGELEGDVRFALDGNPINGFVQSAGSLVLPNATVSVAIPQGTTVNVTGAASLQLSRQIGVAGGSLTAHLSGSAQLVLTQNMVMPNRIDVEASASDRWCAQLPTSFRVVALVANGAQVRVGALQLGNGDTGTLGAGDTCIQFDDVVRRTLINGVFSGQTSATPGYTLTFTPLP